MATTAAPPSETQWQEEAAFATVTAPHERPDVDAPARIIRGFRVAEVGAVEGHGVWFDEVTLDQLVQLGNNEANGIKIRFGHPTGGNGLGTFLGRATLFRRFAGEARADAQFSDAAALSPLFEKDPVPYLLGLAKTDPTAFGASVVVKKDLDGMLAFMAGHGGAGNFRSPDPRNTNNYPHVRIQSFRACDIVDDGAATQSGFLSTPNAGHERTHDMAIFGRKKTDTPSEPTEPQAASVEELEAAFPDDAKYALTCAKEELTLEASRARYVEHVQAQKIELLETVEGLKRKFEDVEADARTKDDQLAAATKRIDELTAAAAENETLKAEMADLKAQVLDGAEPHSHADEPKPGETTLFAAAKAYETEHPGVKYEDCVHAVLKEHPELDGR